MQNLEIQAKTVEEAIQHALEQLGVTREEVKVTVVREGKTGILGVGAEEAIVRVGPLAAVSREKGNIAEIVEDILETLLTRMGIDASVAQAEPFVEGEEGDIAPIAFDISGDDMGILIGRHGQTLAGLQYIVRLMVSHQTKEWLPIVIDVEGYKERRYRTLQTLARNMAEQVKVSGTSFTLEPMSAYERRVVHLALADHTNVTTESIGQGESRKVVISPRGQ